MRMEDDLFDGKICSPSYYVQMAICEGLMLGSLVTNNADDTQLLQK